MKQLRRRIGIGFCKPLKCFDCPIGAFAVFPCPKPADAVPDIAAGDQYAVRELLRCDISDFTAGEPAFDFAGELHLGLAVGAQIFVGAQQLSTQRLRQRLHAFLQRGCRTRAKSALRIKQRAHFLPCRRLGRAGTIFGCLQIKDGQLCALVAGDRDLKAVGKYVGKFLSFQRFLVRFLFRQAAQLAVHAYPHSCGCVSDFQFNGAAERQFIVESAGARLIVASQDIRDNTVFGQHGRKCDTILNHTVLYEYRHGKMLMHLIFTFESLNVLNSPGECMRYYRQLRGLTTRQLAEKLNIVPATVLGYEQGRFPIPYEITVAITKMLQIPESLLFDDYCVFISAPYTELLHTVRKRYGLNQVDFAEKACISPSIYAKLESGSRRPSRKMYQQLKVIYPEI